MCGDIICRTYGFDAAKINQKILTSNTFLQFFKYFRSIRTIRVQKKFCGFCSFCETKNPRRIITTRRGEIVINSKPNYSYVVGTYLFRRLSMTCWRLPSMLYET